MTPAALLRELARPVTDAGLLLALISFSLVTLLAGAAGLFGLWLAVILLPALYKYLLLVLEARAHGRPTPVPGIELFSLVDNLWSLVPLLFQVAVAAAVWTLRHRGAESAALALGIAGFAALPASVALLAVTRSPLASLNPVAWWRLMRACGIDYAVLLVALAAVGAILWTVGLELLGWLLPASLARNLVATYELFLLFTLTGAVLHGRNLALDVEMPEPTEGRADPEADLARARENVLTHAYGFASRGNARGGLRHIEQAIVEDPEPDSAWPWYFERMLAWPVKDPALELARSWLARLLADRRDTEALKLVTRCLRENAAFRPRPADLAATLELARRFRRDDLLRPLEEA